MEIAFDQVVGFTAIFLAGVHVTSLFVPLTLDSVIYGSLGETTGYFLSASLVLRIYFYYYFFFAFSKGFPFGVWFVLCATNRFNGLAYIGKSQNLLWPLTSAQSRRR